MKKTIYVGQWLNSNNYNMKDYLLICSLVEYVKGYNTLKIYL